MTNSKENKPLLSPTQDVETFIGKMVFSNYRPKSKRLCPVHKIYLGTHHVYSLIFYFNEKIFLVAKIL